MPICWAFSALSSWLMHTASIQRFIYYQRSARVGETSANPRVPESSSYLLSKMLETGASSPHRYERTEKLQYRGGRLRSSSSRVQNNGLLTGAVLILSRRMQFGPDNAEYGDVNSAMGMQRHYRVMAGAVSLRSRKPGQPAMENKLRSSMGDPFEARP